MSSVVCVASEATALPSLLVRVGPLVGPQNDLSQPSGKKRSRSDSLDDVTDSDRGKSHPKKKRSCLLTQRPEGSMLSDMTWNSIQSMIASSKNLRTITRVTLAFFKEHELAHMRMTGLEHPVYPVAVPVSEVYSMLAPRKRRVYDVLHVLEGIGILKRSNERPPRIRGGQFLYFGADGARTHLEEIRERAQGISQGAAVLDPTVTQHSIDIMLLTSCNTEANIKSWPYLAATTVAFLSFVLENGSYNTNSLGLLNQRLVDARLACDDNIPDEGREGILAETNRRVYEVVSVLATLNLVILSSLSGELKKESGRRPGYATPRKGIAFNKAVFTDASLIRVGSCCASHLKTLLLAEKKHERKQKKPQHKEKKVEHMITEPQTRVEAPVQASQESITGEGVMVPSYSVADGDTSLLDLFPDIEPSDCTDDLVDWWDVPLRDMLLRDALPLVDFLDWEIMQAVSRSRLRAVGDPVPSISSEVCDRYLAEDADLECHEELEAA